MDRFAITIRPGVSEEGMLRVHDAMQQVIDALIIFGQAEHAMSPDRQILDWRLEKASTNSPFTVVALAGPMRENEDISGSVVRVKSEVSPGLKESPDAGFGCALDGLTTRRGYPPIFGPQPEWNRLHRYRFHGGRIPLH